MSQQQYKKVYLVTHMSDTEVRAVRWVEHILAPLLIASVITLSTCAMQTQEAIAELQVSQKNDQSTAKKTEVAIKEVKAKQDVIISQQHNIEVNVQRIDTRQEHFTDEISDLKSQNAEIIRILTTGNGNNNGH